MRIPILIAGMCFAMLLACIPAGAATLHDFYGRADIRSKAAFLARLQSPHLRPQREKLVVLFNSQWGSRIGRVMSFEELIRELGGDDFVMRACEGPVTAFGVTDAGAFKTVVRPCYTEHGRTIEDVLYYRRSHEQIFSFDCGNLFAPPPIPVLLLPQHRIIFLRPGTVYGIIKCGSPGTSACRDQLVIIRSGGQRVSPAYID